MARRIPPLNWLRAFEAAARHLSLTRAAEELGVTQAAVSQHVKALEQRLGIPLFRRVRQRLYLTDAGQAYLPNLRQAFDLMDEGTTALHAHERQGNLTVRAAASFSLQWLVPRLERFHAAHPDLDIRLTAQGREVDFARDDIDLEIRHGDGRWPDLQAVPLVYEEVFPVCSPDLVTLHPLNTPADLAGCTLLDVPGYAEDWDMWLAAAGAPALAEFSAIRFDQSAVALQAAVNGVGVALGRTPLVAGELAAGHLIAPFTERITGASAYHIVYPERAASQPRIAAFRDWLLEEAAAG